MWHLEQQQACCLLMYDVLNIYLLTPLSQIVPCSKLQSRHNHPERALSFNHREVVTFAENIYQLFYADICMYRKSELLQNLTIHASLVAVGKMYSFLYCSISATKTYHKSSRYFIFPIPTGRGSLQRICVHDLSC